MNVVGPASQTEDDYADDELMFEFEQELETQLTLDDRYPDRFSPHAASRSPTPFTGAAPFERPSNPVAAFLDNSSDPEDDDDDEHEHEVSGLERPPRPSSPFVSFARSVAGVPGSEELEPPTPLGVEPSPPVFDFNGRRKRKFFDDSCCVTPRVRPMAKRAKSFSSVREVFPGLSTSPFRVMSTAPAPIDSVHSPASTQLATTSSRSETIQIPRRRRSLCAGDAASLLDRRSARAANSPPNPEAAVTATTPTTSSPLEYFCRRSLDISSPLRLRLRDLVVGSIGRAGSLSSS
ncbi:hypothetical protein P43SY_008216 [Pythium insidiosum]|uniref:Uncharacterized protein n=1 Tax=Pythium insidiosum TaxID=114742 RepID=A0AAD5Q6W6_PYTIN|nr:hypothetical protein P43SY_008216 [Pythium insidiosum]